MKKDEIVHLAIRDIRRRYNADRVYLWQFHNGGTFYTTSPMQRMSITYERCSDGLERKAERNQNHFITNLAYQTQMKSCYTTLVMNHLLIDFTQE